MSALGVSVTRAEGDKEPANITVDESPAVITGTQTGPLAFHRSNRETRCETANFTGSASNRDTTLTLIPAFQDCVSALGPKTVEMTGCDFVLHLEKTTTVGEDDYTARMDLKCPHGQAVHIKIYTNQLNHSADSPACEYTYGDEHEGEPVNQGLNHLRLTNEPASEETPDDWILGHAEVEGLHSTRTVGSALICGPLTDSNGSLEGEIALKAQNAQEESVGLTVSTDSPLM